MKNQFRISILIIVLAVFTVQTSYSQYTSKKIKPKFESYTDSLKNVKYNYIFPFLGQQAYSKGFDIPYPAGLMGNSVWMKQDLVFTNFQLGFENEDTDIPLQPVDFIQFGENTNKSQNYTFRPDLWVFPFLNVYGLFGAGTSKTTVNVVAPITFGTEVEQEFNTKGFGAMLAGGVGPVWLTVDANWTWNKPKLLDEPVRVTILGIRSGYVFKFNNRPQSNIAIWAGAMRAKMASETNGQISVSEVFPNFDESTDQIVSDYNDWYETLNPVEQAAADKVLTPIVNAIGDADGDGVISYSMDKQIKQLWNGLIGAQYQLNKHWQLRTEAGVIGNRKSFLASINYRFLFLKK
jgi:hypothetical protein